MYASNSRIQNMSNDLPPFVSNSPPPLCHSDSVESDDDFGDFSSNYEAYDSPKKKAPDLFNGIIEHSVDDFIPPSPAPPSQTVIPLVNHHNINSNEIQPTHNDHSSNKKKIQELPAQVETNHSLDETDLSNQLSISNHVNSCTETGSSTETQPVQSMNSSSVSEDCALSSNNLQVNSLESAEPSECNIHKESKEVPQENSLKQEEENVFSNSQENTTCIAQSTCDSSNSTDNFSIDNCVADVSNSEINNCVTDVNNCVADVSHCETVTDTDKDLNIPADVCDNQSKPKRGISNEIKKFLEHEKNIENEFTQFESKFRSFDIPSCDGDVEISSDTPPTSPEFGPKLSKSFDDDDLDDYGTFEHFTNEKPEVEEEDFGDFECSEVVETTLMATHEIKNIDKQVVKRDACMTEDGLSTKDIQLEFNEQNICDNEVAILQDTSSHNASTEVHILPPPLDVEEIYFEDNTQEDISFETDFSQFESASIVTHVNHIQSKTCDNNQASKGETVLKTHVENESSSFFESSQSTQEEEDADFGDFSNFTSSVPEPSARTSCPLTDDEFGDLTSETVSAQNKFDLNSLDMTSLFEKSTQELPECSVITLDQILSQDEAWRRLHDIENTPALSYQWSNSESNKALLSALNIDTRNIIYGPRWKENVPRFAANLGYSPLEPSKFGVMPGDASSPQQEHIPDAHFDWNGSGLTNPLDGRSKSSRQTLEEELTSPTTPTPVPASKVLHPPTTTPAASSRSSQSELIINVDKFVDSLPSIGFMLSQQVVFPSK
uniref:Aftiphilin n=1 Tax=Cacopsylla melanoneura TaxID=428564 RepID=A0A8D9BYU3_9HEMI